MRIEITAWMGSGPSDCGHPHDAGDACYVLRPVIGMMSFATTCEVCGGAYVRAMQRLARAPSPARSRVSHGAEEAARLARAGGMMGSAVAWRDAICGVLDP